MTLQLPETSVLIDPLKALTREVAAFVLALRRRGVTSSIKEDASLVTNADHAAEDIIKRSLTALTPDIPIIAEESVHGGDNPSQEGTYWLVDPIDGTQDFARGGSNFAIHIGLVSAHRPVLGVVALPALGVLFSAQKGRGAWREDGAGITRISCAPRPCDTPRVVVSRNCLDLPEFIAWQAQYPYAQITSYGSSIKFMRVAEGQADIYPRFTPSMEWDTAAPQIIVEEAGGVIRDMQGGPLTYGKENWLNFGFICCSAGTAPMVRWDA